MRLGPECCVEMTVDGPMNHKIAILLLIGVLGVGAGLRMYLISERSMWFDEASAFTSIGEFGWGEMIERCGRNVHPPLYYIVLRLWAACFGESVVALRSLSVLLALLT